MSTINWWLLQCSLSWQQGQPSGHRQVNCFPVLGSCSMINWAPSGKSSVVMLIRQWNGCPKRRLKLAWPIIWNWSSTSPAQKSKIFQHSYSCVNISVSGHHPQSDWIKGAIQDPPIHILALQWPLIWNPVYLWVLDWIQKPWLPEHEEVSYGEWWWVCHHSW